MTKALTALALAAAMMVPGGAAQAADRAPPTPNQQLALDIYRDVIAIRTARGQAKTPEMVAYLVDRLKQAGFTDADDKMADCMQEDAIGNPPTVFDVSEEIIRAAKQRMPAREDLFSSKATG